MMHKPAAAFKDELVADDEVGWQCEAHTHQYFVHAHGSRCPQYVSGSRQLMHILVPQVCYHMIKHCAFKVHVFS